MLKNKHKLLVSVLFQLLKLPFNFNFKILENIVPFF